MISRKELTPADLDIVEEIILDAPKTLGELAVIVADRMGVAGVVERARVGDVVKACAQWLTGQGRVKVWMRKGLAPVYLAPSKAEQAAAAIRLANAPQRAARRERTREQQRALEKRRAKRAKRRQDRALTQEITPATVRR
jgi:hypothetical protein